MPNHIIHEIAFFFMLWLAPLLKLCIKSMEQVTKLPIPCKETFIHLACIRPATFDLSFDLHLALDASSCSKW